MEVAHHGPTFHERRAMVPETSNTTFCLMAFHSQSSSSCGAGQKAPVPTCCHMTRPAGQPGLNVIYRGGR
jgi:hypothetical protein